MHLLGFIKIKNKRSRKEEDMLTLIWKMIGGTNDNYVKTNNLLIALSGVINI